MRIHQLPPAIANQIAAGEVIERPASVVKELLENSLDANASQILIEVSYGGLNQIKISDNGLGINADDLPLAIAAHATSKISKLDDLYAISSMGFRGEALASIASVAKVVISSKTAEQDSAMMLSVKHSELSLVPCARNVGTTVDVIDLFFNAPVRKRFLKSEKIEFQAIELLVKRFALSAPQIAITLKHNNKLVFTLPAAINEKTKKSRVSKIFGSAFMKNALFLQAELGNMRLEGWISGPEYQRSQNDRLWIYINQRMVKDKLIHHAIKQAYDELLHPGRFPACLLYFTMNTEEVDVNVHPTKHEVRFQQPRLVHDFFIAQITSLIKENRHMKPEKELQLSEPDIGMNYLNVRFSEDAFVKKNSPPDTGDPWIVLNSEFALICSKQQPILVDVAKLYPLWLEVQLKNTSSSLQKRPLLVPVSFSCSEKLQHRLRSCQQALTQLGLEIDWSAQNAVVIKTVPVMMPYLDLRLLLQLIEEVESAESILIDTLFCQAQCFDLLQLNLDERLALNQFLFQTTEKQGLYKMLTPHECRMFLHA